MIPKTSGTLRNGITFATKPSKTIQLNSETKHFSGFTDGLDAVRQAAFVILHVERYEYIIHSWNFGVELKDLFGKQMTYVMPEVKRRVRDALLQDDRITEVDEFVLTPNKNKLTVECTVHSVFGDFPEGVTINV